MTIHIPHSLIMFVMWAGPLITYCGIRGLLPEGLPGAFIEIGLVVILLIYYMLICLYGG